MSDLSSTDVLRALEDAYGATTTVVVAIPERNFDLPTRCQGWTVRDLLFHQLLDAALATPAHRPPTTDFVDYWRDFKPGMPGSEEHADFVRKCAAAFSSASVLVALWMHTSQAALHAASESDGGECVETQGLSIAVPDLVATLAVEAGIHHLDLTVELTPLAEPPWSALRLVRRTLDGLLRMPLPSSWDDRVCALKGTGRLPLGAEDCEVLGGLAASFPLLG